MKKDNVTQSTESVTENKECNATVNKDVTLTTERIKAASEIAILIPREKRRGFFRGMNFLYNRKSDDTLGIVHTLADPEKRKKLRSICESLGRYKSDVRYGIHGPTMLEVEELLTAF